MSKRSPFGNAMCILYGSIARHTAFILGGFEFVDSEILQQLHFSGDVFRGAKTECFAEDVVAIGARVRATPRSKDWRVAFASEERHHVPNLCVTIEVDKVPCRQWNGVEVVDHADGLLKPQTQEFSVVGEWLAWRG